MTSIDWFAPGSLSFEIVKGLPTAFVTLVIGVIAAYVAWHQWRVARAKLNLDLFDKRYQIFDATWTELSDVLRCPNRRSSPDFTNLIPQAEFLFGRAISTYMREAADKTTQLWLLSGRLEKNQGPIASELANELQMLTEWFNKHAMDECKAKFAPYLDFSEWR